MKEKICGISFAIFIPTVQTRTAKTPPTSAHTLAIVRSTLAPRLSTNRTSIAEIVYEITTPGREAAPEYLR